jgi:hypothetical protein
MRAQLKFTLPVAQMLLAVVLWWYSNGWEIAARRINDMPGPSPTFDLLGIISWPVAILRSCVFWHFYGIWDAAASIAAIGLFWYWVALNINAWGERKIILMFKWSPLRIAGDLALILAGAVIGLLWAATAARGPLRYTPRHGPDWLWFALSVTLGLMWSGALIVLYGRDLAYCILRRNPVKAIPIPG